MSSHRFFFFFFFFFFVSPSSPLTKAFGNEFPAALHTLQKQIGYQFKRVDLLRRAMTHASFSRDNNRALSILGLSTLQTAVSLRFLGRDPELSSNDLTHRIAHFTGGDSCAADAFRLELQKVVRVSVKTNSSNSGIVCSAFRAMFGAVAIDSGKADTAGDVFWKLPGDTFWKVRGAAYANAAVYM